jgi:hypothetical protein
MNKVWKLGKDWARIEHLKITIQLDSQNLFTKIENMVWTLSQMIFESYHSLDNQNMCIEI